MAKRHQEQRKTYWADDVSFEFICCFRRCIGKIIKNTQKFSSIKWMTTAFWTARSKYLINCETLSLTPSFFYNAVKNRSHSNYILKTVRLFCTSIPYQLWQRLPAGFCSHANKCANGSILSNAQKHLRISTAKQVEPMRKMAYRLTY